MSVNKEATRYFSSAQENYIAKKFGFYTSANSGGGKFKKGDIYSLKYDLTVECKTTTSPKESFSIKKQWLIDAKKEALSNHTLNSCLAISFEPEGNDNYYIIDEKLFAFLLEQLEKNNC